MRTGRRNPVGDLPLRARRLIFAGYLMLVLLLSVMPQPGSGRMPDIPHLDKVIHFAVYAGMAVLFLFAAPRAAMGTIKAGIAAVCGCIAYGLLLELIQGLLTESRQMSSGDFIANSLGALGGTVLFMRILCCRKARSGRTRD